MIPLQVRDNSKALDYMMQGRRNIDEQISSLGSLGAMIPMAVGKYRDASLLSRIRDEEKKQQAYDANQDAFTQYVQEQGDMAAGREYLTGGADGHTFAAVPAAVFPKDVPDPNRLMNLRREASQRGLNTGFEDTAAMDERQAKEAFQASEREAAQGFSAEQAEIRAEAERKKWEAEYEREMENVPIAEREAINMLREINSPEGSTASVSQAITAAARADGTPREQVMRDIMSDKEIDAFAAEMEKQFGKKIKKNDMQKLVDGMTQKFNAGGEFSIGDGVAVAGSVLGSIVGANQQEIDQTTQGLIDAMSEKFARKYMNNAMDKAEDMLYRKADDGRRRFFGVQEPKARREAAAKNQANMDRIAELEAKGAQ
jgi:hypothetical protein